MFKPKYQPNQKILTTLNEIERIYGQLEGMRIPENLLLSLNRDNLMQSVYSSNRIEGNSMSRVEVTNLLLGDRVPVNRDEKEVKNYFSVLTNLPNYISKPEPVSVELALKVHFDLMSGIDEQNKGKIRNEKIVIGHSAGKGRVVIKHNPPVHTGEKIDRLLGELFSWIEGSTENSILKVGVFHHRFVYIHPFIDGNGRTCRLLSALLLLKYGYKINKYFVLDDYYDIDRIQYSDMLHSADSGDETKWLEYFIDGVKYSLQSALGKAKEGVAKLSIDLRPTPKEREVLELVKESPQITSSDLVEHLNITRQQAFNLIKGLTEKGYLEKKGGTKNSYYIMK
jgi:Fic family protein